MQDIKNVQVCWNKNDYVNLDYYDPGAKAEDFPGYNFPTFANNLTNEVYHMPNPMPGFVDKVLAQFDYDIKSPAFNLMKPGQVLPFHKDQYGQYIKKYNLTDITKIQRYIIFLEDAKLGHMFAFEEKVFYNWKAGDVVSWTGQKKHAAYNMGTENRYTLQITCTKI
jgi:hypothetical protein